MGITLQCQIGLKFGLFGLAASETHFVASMGWSPSSNDRKTKAQSLLFQKENKFHPQARLVEAAVFLNSKKSAPNGFRERFPIHCGC